MIWGEKAYEQGDPETDHQSEELEDDELCNSEHKEDDGQNEHNLFICS